jgi:hypothetical protein
MTWTLQEEVVLREYVEAGKPFALIAFELKKTVACVKQKAYRMGLRRLVGEGAASAAAVRNLNKHLLSKEDLASRIAKLLKNEIPEEVGARRLTDEELLGYTSGIEGLGLFLKDLCSVELQDYQLRIVERLMGPRPLVCVTGRQVGKDFTIACFSLWEAITKANSKTLIISAAQRQSDLLNDRILAFIAGRDELYSSVEKSGREELRFKNASTTFFLPTTGLIRGYTEVDRVFFNEARDIPELAYDAVTPMLSRRNGRLAVFSTPLGRAGRLWELWNSLLYEKIQVRSDQNRFLNKDFLVAERDRMSNASYRCEYEGEFVASQQNYFDPESIQKAAEDYALSTQAEEGVQYAFGIDWGRKADASVIVVLARDVPMPQGPADGPTTIGRVDGVLTTVPARKTPPRARLQRPGVRVQFIKSFEGVNFTEQVEYVVYLARTFNPLMIVAEETGLGMGPCDSLKKQLGRPVVPFKTTSQSKIEIYGLLRNRFDRGEITIPLDPLRLKRELELLEYDTLPSGAVRIGHPSGEHDDFPDALALANWAFKPQPKVFRLIAQNVGEPYGRGAVLRY